MNKKFYLIFFIPIFWYISLNFWGSGTYEPFTAAAQGDGYVNILLFGTEECEVCREVNEYVLPDFKTKYPQIEIHYFDLDVVENYEILLQLEKKFQHETTESPIIVIGDNILDGKEEIEKNLDEYIRLFIKRGGCALPDFEIRGKDEATVKNTLPLYMALFIKPGCKECDRTYTTLKYLQNEYPHLQIRLFDVSHRKDILIQETLAKNIGIPAATKLLAPMVILGADYLIKEKLTISDLEALIQKYTASGSVCLWADISIDDVASSAAGEKIAERFLQFGALAVFGSGLLDGVNPCAFATIIFLISWLSLIGKKGKELLLVGCSFTLAVFFTYFFLGLGLFQFLKRISMMKGLHTAIFTAMSLITLLFGLLSLKDYLKIRQGKIKEVSLQLPKIVKKRIHQVIKKNTTVKGVAMAAFFMGILISLLELACTGQVYLPTIMAVSGIPELELHAIWYLTLYNLAFIGPLVLVFLVTYSGTSSKKLAKVTQSHLAGTKIVTALFFFIISIVLAFTAFGGG